MRTMVWADIVPLGYYATWAMQPNPTRRDYYRLLRTMRRFTRIGLTE